MIPVAFTLLARPAHSAGWDQEPSSPVDLVAEVFSVIRADECDPASLPLRLKDGMDEAARSGVRPDRLRLLLSSRDWLLIAGKLGFPIPARAASLFGVRIIIGEASTGS